MFDTLMFDALMLDALMLDAPMLDAPILSALMLHDALILYVMMSSRTSILPRATIGPVVVRLAILAGPLTSSSELLANVAVPFTIRGPLVVS